MNQPTTGTRDRYPAGHLNLKDSVLFALGAPGWQITASIVVTIGIYFYLPPEGAGLQVQASEEIFLGVLTAYGLARLIGGVIDSLADPELATFQILRIPGLAGAACT